MRIKLSELKRIIKEEVDQKSKMKEIANKILSRIMEDKDFYESIRDVADEFSDEITSINPEYEEEIRGEILDMIYSVRVE
jgi:Glu-tRNA(Gln) amidotransferase subunit E-like FAD-binding protein